MMSKCNVRFGTIPSLLLSLAIGAYVIYQLDWGDVGTTFQDIRYGWLGLALIVFFINYTFRTIRIRTLIGDV